MDIFTKIRKKKGEYIHMVTKPCREDETTSRLLEKIVWDQELEEEWELNGLIKWKKIYRVGNFSIEVKVVCYGTMEKSPKGRPKSLQGLFCQWLWEFLYRNHFESKAIWFCDKNGSRYLKFFIFQLYTVSVES